MQVAIHCDGGSRGNPGPAASAFTAQAGGKKIKEQKEFIGVSTNNVAEYKSLLMALTWLLEFLQKESKVHSAKIFMDSQLVVRQVTGEYKVKSGNIIPLIAQVKEMEREIKKRVNIDISHVTRGENSRADSLVNEAIDEALAG